MRGTNYELQLSIEHVIPVLSNNFVSIPESRKYIAAEYPLSNVEWKKFSDQELMEMTEKAEKYAIENR